MERNRLAGVIIILINIWWVLYHLRLAYLYNCTDILFYSTVPTWVLVLKTIAGLIGIYIGFRVVNKSYLASKGMLLSGAFLVLTQSFEFLTNVY